MLQILRSQFLKWQDLLIVVINISELNMFGFRLDFRKLDKKFSLTPWASQSSSRIYIYIYFSFTILVVFILLFVVVVVLTSAVVLSITCKHTSCVKLVEVPFKGFNSLKCCTLAL